MDVKIAQRRALLDSGLSVTQTPPTSSLYLHLTTERGPWPKPVPFIRLVTPGRTPHVYAGSTWDMRKLGAVVDDLLFSPACVEALAAHEGSVPVLVSDDRCLPLAKRVVAKYSAREHGDAEVVELFPCYDACSSFDNL